MVVDESLVCYIKDLHTDDVVAFNAEKPTGFTDSYSANYETQSVRGRSSPFQSYNSSGPRQISFDIKLALDFNHDLVSVVDRLRDMLKPYKVDVIESPRVRVVIGEMVAIEAVPTSFNSVWSDGYKNGVYRICTLSFSFTGVEDVSSFNTKSVVEISSSAYPSTSGSNVVPAPANQTTPDNLEINSTTRGFESKEKAAAYRNEGKDYDSYTVYAGSYQILSSDGSLYRINYNGKYLWVWQSQPEYSYGKFKVGKGQVIYGYRSQTDAKNDSYKKNKNNSGIGYIPIRIQEGEYPIREKGNGTKCIYYEPTDKNYWVKG